MAGRALAFSDDEILRMAREDYVPVAADDWYQRRREDAEGEFFRSVADQGPRKGQGGSTRQGIYCLTAGGKLLAYRNAGQNPEVMREVLQAGLAAWEKLPSSERAPGAVKVPEHGPKDENYYRALPDGGYVVKVYARALDQAAPRTYLDARCEKGRGDEASRDHLWITREEAEILIGKGEGNSPQIPGALLKRMIRFHFVDNTRGEPAFWRDKDVRETNVRLVSENQQGERLRFRMEGEVMLATDSDLDEAERGYDAAIAGYVEADRESGRLTRFDVVVAGDHWGAGPYTRRNMRAGRAPLGIAFELAKNPSAADLIPPQAAREWNSYWAP